MWIVIWSKICRQTASIQKRHTRLHDFFVLDTALSRIMSRSSATGRPSHVVHWTQAAIVRRPQGHTAICMTMGVASETSCTYVYGVFQHKMTVCEWLRKNLSIATQAEFLRIVPNRFSSPCEPTSVSSDHAA